MKINAWVLNPRRQIPLSAPGLPGQCNASLFVVSKINSEKKVVGCWCSPMAIQIPRRIVTPMLARRAASVTMGLTRATVHRRPRQTRILPCISVITSTFQLSQQHSSCRGNVLVVAKHFQSLQPRFIVGHGGLECRPTFSLLQQHFNSYSNTLVITGICWLFQDHFSNYSPTVDSNALPHMSRHIAQQQASSAMPCSATCTCERRNILIYCSNNLVITAMIQLLQQ